MWSDTEEDVYKYKHTHMNTHMHLFPLCADW